jgi:LysR family transcriptional regulator, glycine cleavage system transcriptional activator
MSEPSLRALKALAETARTGSLTAAAQMLHVTPSAVSHLLRELGHSFNFPILAGKGRLTEAGDRLARRLVTGFDLIEAAVQDASRSAADVRVSTLSSFLTLWLVPRLTGFQAEHPRTRLLLSTESRPVDLHAEPFDCAIRWGKGAWPNLSATRLFTDRPVVVLNPRLLSDRTAPQDLPRLAGRTRQQDWPLLTHALGWPDRPPTLTFETRALAVQAALAGMGVTVVDRNLVAGLLRDGVLAEIVPDPAPDVEEGHFFVATSERLRQRPVRLFRDWLAHQAATSE